MGVHTARGHYGGDSAIRLSAYPPSLPSGLRARSFALPRHSPRRRGGGDLRWADGRAALRNQAGRRDRRVVRRGIRADHPFRGRSHQGRGVAQERALRQRRHPCGRGVAAGAHREEDVARPGSLLRRCRRRGAGRQLAPRLERLRLRQQVHGDAGRRGALVSGAAPFGARRRPRRRVEAQVPRRVQAATLSRRHHRPAADRGARRVHVAPLGHDRRGMDFLGEGLRRALALLFSGDAEVYGIALLTFKIGLFATVVACGLGIPAGFVLATKPFWGRRAALTVVNTALAFPTVVVGLLLYGLLSRRGPLGGLGWLYTWQAIVIGDVILAFPIAAALSAAAVQGVDPRIRRTAETLGAGAWRTAWTVAREARFALAAVITAAFGQVVAEVGAAMIVGGNIRGATRTLTTAVALSTAQGDFGLALALGISLVVVALLGNVALQLLRGGGGRGGGHA